MFSDVPLKIKLAARVRGRELKQAGGLTVTMTGSCSARGANDNFPFDAGTLGLTTVSGRFKKGPIWVDEMVPVALATFSRRAAIDRNNSSHY